MGIRDSRTTHPKQMARRARALERFKPAAADAAPAKRLAKEREFAALTRRVSMAPRQVDADREYYSSLSRAHRALAQGRLS